LNYFHQYADQIDDILGVIEIEDDDDDEYLSDDQDIDQNDGCPRCSGGCNYCLMVDY